MNNQYYCVCGQCGDRTYSYQDVWWKFGLCLKDWCGGTKLRKSYPKPETKGFKRGDLIRFTRFEKTDPEYMQLGRIHTELNGDGFGVSFLELKFKQCDTVEEMMEDLQRRDKLLIPLIAARGHHPWYDVELLPLCDKIMETE